MSRRDVIRQVPGILGLAVVLLASPLGAQTLNNTFGGLSQSSDEPIDIESDMLTVYDAKKYATFKGNVKAVRGKGEAVPVANQPATKDAQGGDGAEARISKIEARGSVVITSEDDQTTTSDWALFDVPSQLVTVGGNVVLSQGQNVLKGDRLVIDLNTGESRFENTGPTAAGGGRIRALFMPKQGNGPGANAKHKTPASSSAAGDGENPAESQKAPAAEGPAANDNEPLPLVPEFR